MSHRTCKQDQIELLAPTCRDRVREAGTVFGIAFALVLITAPVLGLAGSAVVPLSGMTGRVLYTMVFFPTYLFAGHGLLSAERFYDSAAFDKPATFTHRRKHSTTR